MTISNEQISQFDHDGFLLCRGLFDAAEIELLRRSAKEDKALDDHSFGRADGEGGTVRLSLWNHPGQGVYGAFARCERLVSSVELLLRDEAYHYHSKMIMKDARVGGAWAWHQDYGYWYGNGVLTPNLVSAFIAVDPATQANGDFTGYLKTFAVLKTPVDAYFESVMVMVDDPEVRRNRLALLRDLRDEMNRIADISKLAA